MSEYRVKVREAEGVRVVARTDSIPEAFNIFLAQEGPAVVMTHPGREVLFTKGADHRASK